MWTGAGAVDLESRVGADFDLETALDLDQSLSSEGNACKPRLGTRLCWPKIPRQAAWEEGKVLAVEHSEVVYGSHG